MIGASAGSFVRDETTNPRSVIALQVVQRFPQQGLGNVAELVLFLQASFSHMRCVGLEGGFLRLLVLAACSWET